MLIFAVCRLSGGLVGVLIVFARLALRVINNALSMNIFLWNGSYDFDETWNLVRDIK